MVGAADSAGFFLGRAGEGALAEDVRVAFPLESIFDSEDTKASLRCPVITPVTRPTTREIVCAGSSAQSRTWSRVVSSLNAERSLRPTSAIRRASLAEAP